MQYLILPVAITILVWVLNHNIRKANKKNEKKTIESFLKREDNANLVRRKDISNLPYIHVPLEHLPLDITLKDEKKQSKIENYHKQITYLSEKQMLNLIGISNTELKERYGVANLEKLSTYDGNYGRMLSNLQNYAATIYDEYPDEAVTILEYMINEGTDISSTFELLGSYYIQNGNPDACKKLYDRIPDKNSVSGKMIQEKLDRILEES
ncbi:MAG: hypothetical protein K6G76_01330 [Lachnospiraceae bacterium]|nr:hypothetical protein [Lachnospiraceae bacterium]